MKYKGYTAKVDFDDDAGIFHGEIINLRDVITFEGKTVEELKQAFRDSVEDYLDNCTYNHFIYLTAHFSGQIQARSAEFSCWRAYPCESQCLCSIRQMPDMPA